MRASDRVAKKTPPSPPLARGGWGGLLLCVLVVSLTGSSTLRGEEKPLTLRGEVVALAPLLEKEGSKLDADSVPLWLGLVTKDGNVYPIVKDAGGRRFFKDKRLLNRPVEVTGKTFRDTHLLQVLTVRGVKDGKLTDIYYWCDICQIRRHELNECECCGGEMVFKEILLKD